MTLILILLVGGIIGWLASILMRTDAQQGIFLNIVVGVVGIGGRGDEIVIRRGGRRGFRLGAEDVAADGRHVRRAGRSATRRRAIPNT